MIVLNAFSANMLAEFPATVTFHEVTAADVALTLSAIEADGDTWDSAVGHADTAAVFSAVLSGDKPGWIDVPCNRATVALRPGDTAILGQYRGPRMPEGATTLPEGATIQWLLVTVGG